MILMTIAPLCVPALMASNAPFRVVNEPLAVPDVAVRVTACEYPARLPVSRNIKKNVQIEM